MMIGLVIAFGLFLLMVGAVLVDMSNAQVADPAAEPDDQRVARENLGLVWGPALAHVGMFFFVIGLIGAAVFTEEMDTFVRLFLLVLAFVALLLVLANSPTIFG